MKNKATHIVFITMVLMAITLLLTACGHQHSYGQWVVEKEATCTTTGTRVRECECGEVDTEMIAVKGHIILADDAIPATCISDGKTAGSHCGVCSTVIVEQTTIASSGHVPIIDSEIPATCTTDGKTEGAHCGVCKATLVPQTTIKATGHRYGEGRIITVATCLNEGEKQFACTVANCQNSYIEAYSLRSFSATEIYKQAIKYVGEIITYDISGAEKALGTGFVISADGEIATNYHVIEGAYSATISIDGTTYDVAEVLAYNADIDLAVLKINANNLTVADICKQAVSVGESVYAIGSSRGMTNTFSHGIITYADRIVDQVSHIQHDASICNGNSGGPLINIYGEVIGINTWAINDSQNLNFAVSASELDNLLYETPLSMSDFYLKECDAFTKMKNYILANGTYNSESNCYILTLDITYSSDYTYKFTRRAYYYVEDEEITLDYIINDGENWSYFVIDPNLDGVYYWSYFDEYDYKMSGTIYAATYDSDSLLGYSYNNISNSSLRDSVRQLASTMISAICSWIDSDFSEINVTAEDLHFYCY